MRKPFLIVLATLAFLPLWLANGSAFAATTPVNLIANPSVETVSPSSTNMPDGWEQDNWGTNSATFTYVKNAGQSGTHSLTVTMKSYTNGDAKWFFDEVPVSASTSYTYSEYYKSTAYSEALAEYIDVNGNRTFSYLGLIAPSTAWQNWTVTVKTPAKTASMTVLHILDAVGTLQTDNFSLALTTASSLQLAVTAPAANATVSCTVALTATLSGTGTLKGGVQFQVDGKNVGSAVTKAPYTVNWNSTTVADGQHSITAVATDSTGQQVSAVPVTVTVANSTFTPAGNLIANGSVEQTGCSSTTAPLNWATDSWGTNNAKFTYLTTGHTGSRSLKANITSYTSGDAKWMFDAVKVQPNSLYTYTEWYQTNATDEEIIVAYYNTDGTTTYEYMANPAKSTTWAKFSVTITTYANTSSLSILHTLDSTGYVISDDYSLMPYTPSGFNRGMVSITFDDGLVSAYNSSLPVLDQYGMKATWYIVPGFTNTDTYMTTAQVTALKNDGMELGSHTMTHPDLTTLTASQLQTELQQSQSQLQSTYGVSADDFASPFGSYNATTVAAIKQYYAAHRTTDVGYNSKDNFDVYHIVVQNMTWDTTPAQVQEWVNQAMATKTWLVLVYHDVGDANSSTFNTPAADFAANMQAIAQSGITVKTVDQAIAEIKSQL